MRSGLKRSWNDQQGVTLVELLVAVFMFVFIIGFMATMFSYFFDSYFFVENVTNSNVTAKYAVDRISSTVREAKTSEEGAYPLIDAGDTSLAFYSDVDDDGEVERIRFFIDGGQLKQGLVEPGSPPQLYTEPEQVSVLIDAIDNQGQPIFEYFNELWPGDTINNPLDEAARLLYTRMVGIRIPVNYSSDEATRTTLETKVLIRNLKTNY